MKKLLSIVMLFMMLSCICNAKTIVWKDGEEQDKEIKDKYIQITEQVEEVKNINLTKLLHDIQQCEARIAYEQEKKAKYESELAEIKTELKLQEVDGVYTIK